MFTLAVILLALALLATFLVVEHGLGMCENVSMMKRLMSGFFLVYAILAIGLKLALPSLPADRIAFSSITDFWVVPMEELTVNLEIPSVIETVFASGELGEL